VVRLTLSLAAICLLALAASASSVWDLVSSSPRPQKASRKASVLEKGYAVPAPAAVTNTVEKVVTVERPVTNVIVKTVEKPVVVEKTVTNTVEKVVYDRSMELRLAKDKAELERRGGALAEQNAGLEKRNAELQRQLDAERAARGRLERANGPKSAKPKKTGRPARITSKSTYYDRKKGVAVLEGSVYVDDESYQLHAEKAYVFMAGTNDVRRIVAVGNVAMTNEARRAYGGKVSYYRKDGMVVLYAGGGRNAEIRDESKTEDQTILGSKIKFWIDNEQVEILDAAISAPTDGAGLSVLPK